MAEQIKFIAARAVWQRSLLLVPIGLALLGMWFAARWGFATTIAEFAPDLETAQFAARLAPDDPQTHFTLAVLRRKSLSPEELPEALREYEEAARLSPHDYRLWMELGRVRGQAGDLAGGERALGRAVALAPTYALPRWHLGNLLLRAERTEEAFAELRRAAQFDPALRPQVFNLAWRVYDADVSSALAVLGDTPTTRAELTAYFIKQKRLDEARQSWASLKPAGQREQREVGETLLRALVEAKRYRAALEVQREIGTEGAPKKPDLGHLLNGGFEEEVDAPGKSFWGWQVAPAPQVQIGLDARLRRGGARSLRLVFNAYTTASLANVAQLIVVEPGARYRLQYQVRAEDLKSVSTVVIEIADGADQSRVLATAEPLANGTIDWQPVTIDFTVPAQTEAITLRLESSSLSGSSLSAVRKNLV